MEQVIIRHSEGTILAAKARDEFIETGKTTVRCPKCGEIPNIDIQGTNHSHVNVRCECGYIKLYSKGI